MNAHGWHFKARPSIRGGFIAWCARTPDLGNGPLDVDWSMDVRFAFGETAEEALAAVKREVLS